MRVLGRVGAVALLAGGALVVAAGCGQDCCTVDSFPIALTRAPLGAPSSDGAADGGAADGAVAPIPGGALEALAALPGAMAGDLSGDTLSKMIVDTGSPFTVLGGPSGANPQTSSGGWNLYGADVSPPPLRAAFRDWDVLRLPLQSVGDPVLPFGVLGADLLREYSVEFRFGARCATSGSGLCSSMTFWNHLGEDTSLLEDAGYAVVAFTAFGGGEVTAEGDPDLFGLRGPLTVPATRVVLRGCAVPDPFTPSGGSPRLSLATCTNARAAVLQASGVDLSLMIDTGVGPLVLAASAWARIVAAAATSLPTPLVLPPVPTTPPAAGALPPLRVATWPEPIDVLLWTSIPRFALVNLEIGTNDNPGPCVELARARRTEIVSYETVTDPARGVCGAACDVDPNNTDRAQNSAAYLELGGVIPVAVISDDEPFLQGLRFDVLPEGPELDGLVGAAALGRARLELDYQSSPSRAVFSCETDATRAVCWAAARCPQLPDHSATHYCFDLPAHGLPASCAPPDAGALPGQDGGQDRGQDGDAPDAATSTNPYTNR